MSNRPPGRIVSLRDIVEMTEGWSRLVSAKVKMDKEGEVAGIRGQIALLQILLNPVYQMWEKERQKLNDELCDFTERVDAGGNTVPSMTWLDDDGKYSPEKRKVYNLAIDCLLANEIEITVTLTLAQVTRMLPDLSGLEQAQLAPILSDWPPKEADEQE